MRITLKLYATLGDYLPAGAQRNVATLDLEDQTPVSLVIDRLRLPEELVHLVLLNGHYLEPEQRPASLLREGDTLAIWPPIAGG